MKREDVGLHVIVHAISFQAFQPMWSGSTNVTDGQTDDMRSQDRALHYSASLHRTVKTMGWASMAPNPISLRWQLCALKG